MYRCPCGEYWDGWEEYKQHMRIRHADVVLAEKIERKEAEESLAALQKWERENEKRVATMTRSDEVMCLSDEDIRRLNESHIREQVTRANAHFEPQAFERALRENYALYDEFADKYGIPLGRAFTFNLSNGSILLDKEKYEPLLQRDAKPRKGRDS